MFQASTQAGYQHQRRYRGPAGNGASVVLLSRDAVANDQENHAEVVVWCQMVGEG